MPFMDEPPGSKLSSNGSRIYGTVIRRLRAVTARTVDKEPKWRQKGPKLTHRLHEELVGATRMTMTEARTSTKNVDTDVVEMSWDPITRIVGSLGIYASIDFKQKEVRECHSTSSIFRGYSIFMKGKDPRDAHFITSRICGICGDNHATCSVYNAEHGLRRRAAAPR